MSRIWGIALLVGAGIVGVTAIVAGPKILRAGRPLVRKALKRSMELYAHARAACAELVEDVEDLVAEVQAELRRERPHLAEDEDPPRQAKG